MIKIQIQGYKPEELELLLRKKPQRFPITFTVIGTMVKKVHWDIIRMAARKAGVDLLNEPLPFTVKALMPEEKNGVTKIQIYKSNPKEKEGVNKTKNYKKKQ